MKILLFDIDGTLLLDGGAGGAALDEAFFGLFSIPRASADIPKHGQTDYSITRNTALKALGRELTQEESHRLHEHYARIVPLHLEKSRDFCVLRGVVELCDSLHKDKNILMGLQSGNLETVARAKLLHGRIHDYFSFGGFSSDSIDRTKLVRTGIERAIKTAGGGAAVSDIIVVGDSPFDVLAGKANGAKTIAVATGKSTAAELRSVHPTAVLPDLSDIRAFWDIIAG